MYSFFVVKLLSFTKNRDISMDNDFQEVYEKFFPFWSILTESDKKYICENSAFQHFDKEQMIHNNSECSGLYLVKSGKLRLYMLSDEGKQITLYRLGPGDICMLSASCVLQSITFDVYVDAELPSECYVISGQAFKNLSERVLEVKNFALESAVERFSDVMWIMQQIVFMSLDKRLAIFLLDEIADSKSDTILLTHEEIARHLGTAREVITRMLRHFSEDGIVEVTRKGIFICDKNKLRDIAT